MPNPFHSLLILLARATDRELARQIQYLKVENKLLRDKLPKRIRVTRAERARLLKFGQPLGDAINQLISIVVPSTFARWVREAKARKPRKIKPVGRPKKSLDLKRLILKIAHETGWGYTRVLGELRKLTSHKVSRQTVANIMREDGLDPGPKRGEKTWDEFVKIHAHSLWQADFFCKRALTLKGVQYLYVLVFLNVATRRVYVTKATAHPNGEWVAKSASEFCRHARRQKLPIERVQFDADAKFGKAFNKALVQSGVLPRRLSRHSPNLNAFVERWIQSIQVECLDHFLVLSEAHLNYLVSEFVQHYHEERPHQGRHNRLLVTTKPPPPDETVPDLQTVACHERLGGLLKHYERQAA